MKDEKLADKYARHEQCAHCINPQYCQGEENCYRFADVKNHFLAGLKAAKPQWHDLQKDPNDLPENKRNVWCDYGDGCGKGYYSKDDGGWWVEGHLYCSTVDAWCELPTHDKE